jgi:hypothetical protein
MDAQPLRRWYPHGDSNSGFQYANLAAPLAGAGRLPPQSSGLGPARGTAGLDYIHAVRPASSPRRLASRRLLEGIVDPAVAVLRLASVAPFLALNPLEQEIAGWPIEARLIPALVAGIGLMVGVWRTRNDVR